jgi:hypothetical protein
LTPSENFLPIFTTINVDLGKEVAAGVNDTSGNFFAGVNYNGDQFAAGVNDTGAAP